jgi:arylsulfatase A-like enzyme
MTNFELGTRVPFIIRDPSIPASHGKVTQSFAELVDLYKTLADLAGLPAPDSSKVQGRSLKASLLAPDDPGHEYAFSQFAKADNRHGKPWNTCMHCHRDQIDYMGLAIRSDKFRLVQWYAWDKQKERVDFDTLHAEELYPHEGDEGTDFDLYENENLANSSALQPAKEALQARLLQHFAGDWAG